jgi:virulence-associated protein VagC
MQKAKLFPIGRCQALRLPKEFRPDGEVVSSAN